MKIEYKIPVLAGAGLLVMNSITGLGQKAPGSPNILMIIADDCTFRDLPLYGGTNVKTPNIDRLSAQGLTFDRAFVSMSMSVPCRASLYTGLYPPTSGVCWNHVPARTGTKSIVHYLGNLGYRTGLAGKIHATPRSVFPFEMVEGLERDCVAPTAGFNTDEIKKFIERDPDNPFCMIAALVVPHVPWTVGDASHFIPEKLNLPPYLADTKEMRVQFAKYLAEIEVLDQQVGSLLDLLEKTGKAESTIVIFTSEQGAQQPFCKWTNWNTGVHTGFIVRWPGRVPKGKRTNAMIQYEDVLATLVEAAGGKDMLNSMEGKSFLSVLDWKKSSHREYAYFMHNNEPEGTPYPIRSITDGTWHYIKNLKPENIYIEKHLMARMPPNDYWPSWIFQAQSDDRTYELVTRYTKRPPEQLFRIYTDPDEQNDLAGNKEYSEIKKKLAAQLELWCRQEGDPGASIDTREQWTSASKGNHFKITR